MEVPEGAGRKRRFRKEPEGPEGPEGPEVPEGDGTTTGTTFWNVYKANHAPKRQGFQAKILHPSPNPTPNPSPEISNRYWRFPHVV